MGKWIIKAPLWSFFGFCLLVSASWAQLPKGAAIAAAHPAATRAGMEILRAGGNAFDAAVAVSAALAVVEPYSSGLGGGGFWLLHRASDGRQVMIDGREKAPLAAHRDLYLDEKGEVITGLSMNGPLAAGIPGEPAALAHIAAHYGRLPLSQTLAPAIRLAREGFAVDASYRRLAGFRLEVLRRYPATARQFLRGGEVPALGDLIRQPDLATTLKALAERGRAGFYGGRIAQKLVQAVTRQGGIWRMEDLSAYRVVERQPVVTHYHGLRVVSAALPSSGGVVLAQMLNMLALKPLKQLSKTDRIHYLVEVMRRAYHDRARFLGDSDFVSVPLERLLSAEHARKRAATIDMARPTVSTAFSGTAEEGRDTSHFSVIDSEGNRVAATLSINYPFGSGFVAEGTGVLLNDEMDDFAVKPGVANAYGLVGAGANAIAPGKRMLSSMTPTFIEGETGVAIVGTPGGSRIITMVLLALLEFADGQPPLAWVTKPRFHHQYLPDQIQLEPSALDAETRRALSAKGHQLSEMERPWGNMQAVFWNHKTGQVLAASDPRGGGLALVQEQPIAVGRQSQRQ